MHLVDHARAHIQETYRRPVMDRLIRNVLAAVLPYPGRFRAALSLARLGKPFAPIFGLLNATKPLKAMLSLAPSALPSKSALAEPGVSRASGERRGRVAILTGCAQPVLKPGINEATIDLLTRVGVEVVRPEGEACCGALVHHMGRESDSLDAARNNVDVWTREMEGEGLDAIIITASGCGTTIKDYGHMLRLDPAYAGKAAKVSELTMDVTEYLAKIDLPKPARRPAMTVAYHSACSMQHGQKIVNQPKMLLRQAGLKVVEPREGHLCCGSAGTYNILQSEISQKLKARKVANIEATKPDVIATGNIGCITQIASGTSVPIVHTLELLNWIYGGQEPAGIDANAFPQRASDPVLEAAE
jgi:glycolate oxidase iron-sulfur subunit